MTVLEIDRLVIRVPEQPLHFCCGVLPAVGSLEPSASTDIVTFRKWRQT